MNLLAAAGDRAIDDAKPNDFVSRTNAVGRGRAGGTDRVAASMDLEQVRHCRARRAAHTFQHGERAELGDLPRVDLQTAGIDRFDTPDSRAHDASCPVRL